MATPVLSDKTTALGRTHRNFYCTDASGGEDVIAAPAAGLSILLYKLEIDNHGAQQIVLGTELSGGTVVAASRIMGLIQLAANGTYYIDRMRDPIVLGDGLPLVIDTTGSTTVNITLLYETVTLATYQAESRWWYYLLGGNLHD